MFDFNQKHKCGWCSESHVGNPDNHYCVKYEELNSVIKDYLGEMPIQNELNPKVLLQSIKDDLDEIYTKYEKKINNLTKEKRND